MHFDFKITFSLISIHDIFKQSILINITTKEKADSPISINGPKLRGK